MNKIALRIYNVLTEENDYKVRVDEQEDCSVISLDISVGGLSMDFIVRDDNSKVTARVCMIRKLEEKERLEILPAINKANSFFRFLKFYIDQDGNVMADYNFVMQEDDPGDIITELIRDRFESILRLVYPSLEDDLRKIRANDIDADDIDADDILVPIDVDAEDLDLLEDDDDDDDDDDDLDDDDMSEIKRMLNTILCEMQLDPVFREVRQSLDNKAYTCEVSRDEETNVGTIAVRVNVDDESKDVVFTGSDKEDMQVRLSGLMKLENKQREIVQSALRSLNEGLKDLKVGISDDNSVNIVYEKPDDEVDYGKIAVNLVERIVRLANDTVRRLKARLKNGAENVMEEIRDALSAGHYKCRLVQMNDCQMLSVPVSVQDEMFDVDFFLNGKKELSIHLFELLNLEECERKGVQDVLELLAPLMGDICIEYELADGRIDLSFGWEGDASDVVGKACGLVKSFINTARVVLPVFRAELCADHC